MKAKAVDQEAKLIIPRETWVGAMADAFKKSNQSEPKSEDLARFNEKYDEWAAVQEVTTVVWRKMNGWESQIADVFAKKTASRVEDGDAESTIAKTYAVCSLRSVDGQPVTPLSNYTEFIKTCEDLSIDDISLLLGIVFAETQAGVSELKN